MQISQTQNPQNAVITINDVVKDYGDKLALNGITTKIFPASVTAILGKNGAGKTTLIKSCLGLERITKGKIRILGHKPGSIKARQNLGVMLQDTNLPDLLTGAELIKLFSCYYATPLAFDNVIDLTNTQNFIYKKYKNLSGGQKRRIQFALAIAGNPDIIFLDEPTTGLDTKAREKLWRVVRNFKKNGKTIILTTHYLEEADALSDQIIILDNGKILKETPTQQIYTHLGGDIIRCKTDLTLNKLENLSYCHKIKFSGKYALIHSYKTPDLLREILKLDHNLSELSIYRPGLESLFYED